MGGRGGRRTDQASRNRVIRARARRARNAATPNAEQRITASINRLRREIEDLESQASFTAGAFSRRSGVGERGTASARRNATTLLRSLRSRLRAARAELRSLQGG